MNENWNKYLESIGLQESFIKRVDHVLEFYKKILVSVEIGDIFISEYLNKDGIREYEALWFFSNQYIMEAKAFLVTDDFDFASGEKGVRYWNIKKKDYDFEKATELSRLNIEIAYTAGVGGLLKASKENCDHLRYIFLKYIIPKSL
jgi:hypothetical protein